MAKMQAVFYRSTDGTEPVNDFIGRLNVKRQVAIENQIDRLNDPIGNGPPLPFPHSSQVEGELRELRCHYGRELYRILYRRSNNLFVLLHILRKSTGRVPAQDIEMAANRWEDFRARMDAPVRRPPRAVGHDAPPARPSPR
jgi:phage-related protein